NDAPDFFKPSTKNSSENKDQIPTLSHSVHLLKKDMEAKIREDPLFAIKKKEQEAIIKLANSKGTSRSNSENSARSDISEWSSRSSRSISTPLRGNIQKEKKGHKTWPMTEEERNARLLEMKEDAKKHRVSC
ncbi:hypothetical protein DI09_381p10, partial [Mitosporidium daphniae]